METTPAQVPQEHGERACQSPRARVYTIGHSTHSLESFVAMLKRYKLTRVVDVRSSPCSKHVPQFNADVLGRTLPAQGISYVKMGNELGGRPKDPAMYDTAGKADYTRMSRSPEFLRGISRLEEMTAMDRVALMCSEEDPNRCHRWLLVGEYLCSRGFNVHNIRSRCEDESRPATPGDQPDRRLTQLALL